MSIWRGRQKLCHRLHSDNLSHCNKPRKPNWQTLVASNAFYAGTHGIQPAVDILVAPINLFDIVDNTNAIC